MSSANSRARASFAFPRAMFAVVVGGVLLGSVALIAIGVPALAAPRSGGDLRIYYRSPILVRPGERVRIPVDVACHTAGGRSCGATVSLGITDRAGRWRWFSERGRPSLQFDLTGPATRAAVARSRTGSLAYRLSAAGPDGRSVSLPAEAGSLRLYVAGGMRRIAVPTGRSVETRRGRVALNLPWGTGPNRAGLSPGNEAATVGPPSFDVDARGRIYLFDALQGRVAVYRRGKLLRQIGVASVGPQSDIDVARDGTIYLATQANGRVRAQALARSGRVLQREDLGPGILAEIRAPGRRAFLHLLPADAWFALDRSRARPRPGMPLPSGGVLVDSIVGRTVRIGVARGPEVERSFELASGRPLGELALGDADAARGMVAGFRVLGRKAEGPGRYVVIRLGRNGQPDAFAIPAGGFADQPAYSQVRLGGDGRLYQLRTFPDGMRILRYDVGEGS